MNIEKSKLQPLRQLYCSCCGSGTIGRQWHNRDTGYGLCNDCIKIARSSSTDQDMINSYGYNGTHYNIQGV